MPPKREATPAERAQQLLKRARSSPRSSGSDGGNVTSSSWDDVLVPLPRLIHALHTVAGISVVDSIGIVRVLADKKRQSIAHLRRISAPELEEIGAPCTGSTRDRVVQTLQRLAHDDTMSRGINALTDLERTSKQQRMREEQRLRRDWGDVRAPEPALDEKSFAFDHVLAETALKGRRVVVNRAPVMTAWAVVVLEAMGFATNEALSLAHCYVSQTAEARARNIGIAGPKRPASEQHLMSENQPHIEFLRVRIPVFRLRNGEYRGLHAGEVMPPSRAYDYLHRSMFQMLPHVMGALTLLANSYLGPDGNADRLHAAAYELYTGFRPETHGEWGKRASLSLDTILALRATAEKEEVPQDLKREEKHGLPFLTEAECDVKRDNHIKEEEDHKRPNNATQSHIMDTQFKNET